MSNSINLKDLEKNYPAIKIKYEKLGSRIVEVIKTFLLQHSMKVHAVYFRVKEFESLMDKIVDKDKYKTIEEITDVCGARVITYLASEVDDVVSIIKENFVVDDDNSIDKRERENPGEFGYKSVHLVVSMPDTWLGSPTESDLKGLKVEIQIRSILEHAWAEIEHDLGYKSSSAVPYELKRGFTRLAANLEIADIEFDRLKKLKIGYEEEILHKVENPTQPILINPISLTVMVKSNSIFDEVRKWLIETRGVKFAVSNDYDHIISKLEFLGITTIDELEAFLFRNKESFMLFVKLLFERRDDRRTYLRYESPLEYLLHFIASSKGGDVLEEYKYHGTSHSGKSVLEVTDFIKLYEDSQVIGK